jgi:hypothetical protein
MSGSYPTTPVPRSAKISSQQSTIVSVTSSGRKQARQIDGQRFTITLQYPPMSRSEFSPIKAFIMKQRSQLESFTVIPPATESDAQGTASGTPTGTASAGATSITLGGSGSGTLKAGDYIKFANHDKIYMIVADSSDISTGTLTIEPPLRTAVSGQNITYDDVPFTVSLTSDIQEYNIGTTNLYVYELDVVEVL